MIAIKRLPPEHYLQLIRENKPFSFSRFGDGEVLCMFHDARVPQNCDGSLFLMDLIAPMMQIFSNQYDYYHCLLDCSFDWSGDSFREFINKTCSEMPFYDGEIWQEMSFNGRITELVETISLYEPVFVGGSHLKNVTYIKGVKNNSVHLPVPDINAFIDINRILSDIADLFVSGKRMFCFSAGYTTKIIIDTLYPVIGEEAFMIDMGSVFDPYCGKLSRSGMKSTGFEYFKPFTKMKLK